MSSILYRLTLLTSILFLVMSFFSPVGYSYGYIFTLFAITITEVVMFLFRWGKIHGNYLDFEPIFLIIALIMGFAFPLIIYAADDQTAYYFSWGIQYSLNYFNKGACLTALGITAFMAGSLKKVRINRSNGALPKKGTRLDNTMSFTGLIIFLALFAALGGFEWYKYIYHNGDGVDRGILSYLEGIIIALTEVVMINECWNYLQNPLKYKFLNKYILFVIIVALLFATVGNRTIALYIILPILVFFTTNFYKLTFFKFLIVIVMGAIAMIGFRFLRSGTEYNAELDWFYNIADLMIPNTTTYLACEIVDKTGITCGISMLGGSILGAIPFSQSILEELTGIGGDITNSSNVFTTYLGSTDGTGTNFISDPYLGFGAIGVFVVVYLSGYAVNWARKRSANSYYGLLIYLILCGFAVYAVRSSLLFSIRYIFYAVLFSFINLKVTRKCV